MTRLLAFLLPVAILVLVGGGGMFAISVLKPKPETNDTPPQALSVFGEQVERRDLNLVVEAQGEVRPRAEISLTPQVGGRIAYVSDGFLDGAEITRGQVLVRLDTADYELAVVSARAGVATAEQRLARERAESELAIRDLEDLGLTEASPLARREPQLAEAQAALDSANAQLRDAELALERTAIRAPFNGRVREKAVDVGQFVSPGQNLGRVFATDVMEVSLPLTDQQLGQLGLPIAFAETAQAPGPAVVFRAEIGGEMREWRGRIARTSAALNSQSRLINVFGVVEDPYGAGADDNAPLAPGLFVTAEITGQTVEDVLWAPRSAMRGTNQLYIGDQAAGVLSIRPVDVVHTDASGVYFRSGADMGELAIVSPVQAAFDGMRLRIRERLPDGSLGPEPPRTEETAADATLTAGELRGTAQ